METRSTSESARQVPLGQLEQALIEEFLRGRGYDRAALDALPEAERHALLSEASVYASARLTEVETRSRLLHELHGEPGGRLPGSE